VSLREDVKLLVYVRPGLISSRKAGQWVCRGPKLETLKIETHPGFPGYRQSGRSVCLGLAAQRGRAKGFLFIEKQLIYVAAEPSWAAEGAVEDDSVPARVNGA
jgi:hypothetical protein